MEPWGRIMMNERLESLTLRDTSKARESMEILEWLDKFLQMRGGTITAKCVDYKRECNAAKRKRQEVVEVVEIRVRQFPKGKDTLNEERLGHTLQMEKNKNITSIRLRCYKKSTHTIKINPSF